MTDEKENSRQSSEKNIVKFGELLLTVIHVQEALIELLVEKKVIDKKELEVKTAEKIIEVKRKRH